MSNSNLGNTSVYPYAYGGPSVYPYYNAPVNNNYENYLKQQQQQMHQYLKCRPVSSKEEAMAFQIDLDGSLNVFTDVANKKIYTKQINNDGTATFNTYILTQEKEQNTSSNMDYVTREQFNNVVQTLMAAMQQASAPSNKVETQVNNIKF